MPKRGFNQKFDRLLENGLSKLPDWNIAYLLIGLNTLLYGMYLMWPKHQMYQYLNNFTLSNYGLQRGYLHSLFFSHFTHKSLFTYLLDSVILYLFCQNLTMMHGPLFPAKVIILSIAVANALLLLQHSQNPMARPFHGNDALLRGLIFSIIFQNPSASFYMFPFPI